MNAGSGDFRTPVTHDQKGTAQRRHWPTSHLRFRCAPYRTPNELDRPREPPREASSRSLCAAILLDRISLKT
jgi:hypothetical protein